MSMPLIHPTAIVDPAAQLDSSVSVGPYSVIGAHVRIDAGTKVGPHCVIEGRTTIGRDNTFYQFGSIGAMPQDMSHKGELTELRIGDRNTIREFCTLNTGTRKEEGITRVGSDNWIMAYVHVAHDVRLGNRTVLANGDMPETFMPQDLSDLSGITINLASSGAGVPTDLFKTLDGRLKPALDVLVVTDIDTFIETPLASSPAAVNIGFGDSTLPSRRDDFRRVAGEVRVPDAVGALVRSPLGTAIVNAASRFLINAAPGDEIVVELAVPLTAVVPERGGIVIG